MYVDRTKSPTGQSSQSGCHKKKNIFKTYMTIGIWGVGGDFDGGRTENRGIRDNIIKLTS